MYIGVDFGTSFSKTSVFYNGHAAPLVSGAMYGVRSVFYYDSIQGEMVGDDAQSSAQGKNAENIVYDVKMKIGNQFTLDSKSYSSEEIIRAIYKEVINLANQNGNEAYEAFKIDGMVLSHPAKFSMTEINTIISAASTALGEDRRINIIGTIKEPVAAALAYYHDKPYKPKNGSGVLVYDLGGGTCDVALVCADCGEDAEYKVIDSDMIRVGGRDWDKLLSEFAVEKIEQLTDNHPDVRGKQSNLNAINAAVNIAKHNLSKRAEANIIVNLELDGRPSLISIPISRVRFEEITVELLDQTINKLDEIYYRNNEKINIEEIICVGGSSNMIQVKEALEEHYGDCEVRVYKPEYAVVNGSAIYAQKVIDKMKAMGYDTDNSEEIARLINQKNEESSKSLTSIMLTNENKGKIPLADILPLSYGVRCRKGKASNEFVVKNILKRGDSLPVTGEYGKFAPKDDGTSVKIEICESECTDDTYPCDVGMNERIIGTIYLDTPNGASKEDTITCKFIITSLDTIDIEAYDNNGNKMKALLDLNKSPVE